ncbi:MAG TPA: AAA family ATPase [Paucimonas sp.]|nr:AAA family ATPase [Paucimonas sp.]
MDAQDYSGRFELPVSVYGREREKARILEAYRRMRQSGKASLIVVAGGAGIGKSALIRDLHDSMTVKGGSFASGKCDQYRSGIPYAPLTQALDELLRQLLTDPLEVLADRRRRIQQAVGIYGQIIVDILPRLRLVIGKQAPAPEVPDAEAQRRIFRVFRQFIAALGDPGRPLVLFLDDVQWIDNGSRQLVEYLLTDPDTTNLVVIVACRNDESDDQRRLAASLAALRERDVDALNIVLAPLPQETLNRLIADALQADPASCEPLTRQIFKRSNGNPLFSIEFLRALKQDGSLYHDPAGGRWMWDLDWIAGRNLPNSVLELMLGKMKHLPPVAQALLRVAACIGNTFALNHLASAAGVELDDARRYLEPAANESLVHLSGGHGRFLHDRIQQAAYSTIPMAELSVTHLRIAQVLMSCRSEDTADLFDLANHYNLGASLLSDSEEREKVALLNLEAGRKAKAAAAYVAAGRYFEAGTALLDESSWHDCFRLAFDLRFEQAYCALMLGRLDEALERVDRLLQRPMPRPDLANANNLKVLLHVLRGESHEARDSALACLRGFGADLPAHPTSEEIEHECDLIWKNMNGRSIESLIDLPLMTDPDKLAVARVLASLILPGAFTDMKLAYMVQSHMVNFCLLHGVAKELVYGLASFEVVAGAIFRRYADAYRFTRLADRLVDKHAFATEKAKSLMFIGLAAFWAQPLEEAIDNIESCFHAAVANDDLAYACYSLMYQTPHLFMAGMLLGDLSDRIAKNLGFVRGLQVRDAIDNLLSQSRFVAALQGRTASMSDFDGDSFERQSFEAELREGRMPQIISAYWVFRLQASYLARDEAGALEIMEKANDYFWAASNTVYEFMHVYFSGLVMAAAWDAASPDDRRRWRPMLEQHQKLLDIWAAHQPATFGDKNALLLAEIARIDGRDFDAMRHYEQAISAADGNGYFQFAGIACERAAEFHRQRGSVAAADRHVVAMRRYFLRWGAHAKVAQIDARHPNVRA